MRASPLAAALCLAACATPAPPTAPAAKEQVRPPPMRGEPRWGRGLAVDVHAVAPGHAGGVLFAGTFTGAKVTVGDVVVDAVGDTAFSTFGVTALLAELTPTGDVAWVTRTTESGSFYPTAMRVDDRGDIVVVAQANSPVFSKTQKAPADRSNVFARFDAKGRLLSFRAHPGFVEAFDVAFGPGGRRVCMSGRFDGELAFGTTVLRASNAKAASLVACLDDHGEAIWARALTTPNGVITASIAVGPRDEVTVSGNTWGPLEVDGIALPNRGGVDAFVARFDARGKALWARTLGDEKDQFGDSVLVDPSGAAVLVGRFDGAIDLGAAGALHGAPGGDATYVVRLDAAGLPRAGVTFPHMKFRNAYLDPWGDVALAFFALRHADVGLGLEAPPKDAPGDIDFCLAKLDASFKPIWARRFYEGRLDRVVVGVDPAGDLLLGGSMKEGFHVGGRVLEHPTAASSPSGFVARYGP